MSSHLTHTMSFLLGSGTLSRGRSKQDVSTGAYSYVGNTVDTASTYGFVGNGCCNCVTGVYSAILGGSGNTDSGYPYTAIFGCNIVANCSSGFLWTNNIAIPTMQIGAVGLPTGALYYCCVSPRCCAVYID